MTWKELPNEIVRGYDGLPMKHVRLDNDGEAVMKPFGCPSDGCKTDKFTNVSTWQEHWEAKHEGPFPSMNVNFQRDESKTADVIRELLRSLHSGARDNPLTAIAKTNDPQHATEVWRRLHNAQNGAIRLKDAQYDWLQGVLSRKLPLSKDAKETKGEADVQHQTVALHIWKLDAYNVSQAFTVLSDRDKAEVEEKETGDAKDSQAAS